MNITQLKLYFLALLGACINSCLHGAYKSRVQDEKEIAAWITKLDQAYTNENKRKKEERTTRLLDFEQLLRKEVGARLPGDFGHYPIARSKSAANILDVCAKQQLYINCGLECIYHLQKSNKKSARQKGNLVQLSLKELLAFKEKIWSTPCTPGGYGEEVKWGLLMKIQGAENFMRNIQKMIDV